MFYLKSSLRLEECPMRWTVSTFRGAILFFMKDFNLNAVDSACKEKANDANKALSWGITQKTIRKIFTVGLLIVDNVC